MSADDVAQVLRRLDGAQIDAWVDGGWGVDALLGRETRPHEDLDLVIDIALVTAARAALEPLGFSPSTDELPTRLEVRDRTGRQVDFHIVSFDSEGVGVQVLQDGSRFSYPAEGFEANGTIGRRRVRCLSAGVQALCHIGYKLKAKDIHDLRLLHERFGVPMPPGYPPLIA